MTKTDFISTDFQSSQKLGSVLQGVTLFDVALPRLEKPLALCQVKAADGDLYIKFTERTPEFGELRKPPSPERIVPLPMLVELVCHYTRIRYSFVADRVSAICQLLIEYILCYDWTQAGESEAEIYRVALCALPVDNREKQKFLEELAKEQNVSVMSV